MNRRVIIGMECYRYPGSPTLIQLWHTIRQAQVHFRNIPYDRGNHALCPNAPRRADAGTDMRLTRRGIPVNGTHLYPPSQNRPTGCAHLAVAACNSGYPAQRAAERVPVTLLGENCYATGKPR
jgi:hypothetical protein